MAPPPSNAVPPHVSLIVRLLTVVCLVASLVLLTTTSTTLIDTTDNEIFYHVKFKDFKAYRYLCATAVIGLAYTLSQTASIVVQITTGNRFGGDNAAYIDFIGDKIVSYVLVTGAAASYGMSQEVLSGTDRFIRAIYAATSLCFFAFVFTAISSVFSSLSLPKKSA